MTANSLTLFNEGARPAHLDSYFTESNIEDRNTIPSLSYQGKVWSIALNGEKTKLTRKNADGDTEPVTTMKVVVLDYAKRRGRAYYPGVYDPDKEQSPVCWSDDGIKPYDNVPEKQHPKCEGCPMAIKGSKVVGDKQLTACSQHRMLAVVPAGALGKVPPLRLKIAVTSDFDKSSPEAVAQGQQNPPWSAFSQYTDFLKSRGVKHSAELVTKIKFDTAAAYPKLFFAPDRWLEAEEAKVVLPMVHDPETAKLLGGTWTPAGVDGTRTDDTTALEAPATKEQAATAEVAKAQEPTPAQVAEDEGDDEIIFEGINAPPAAAVQEPAQAAVTPEPVQQKPEPAKAAEKAATAAPAAEKVADPALEELLKGWE